MATSVQNDRFPQNIQFNSYKQAVSAIQQFGQDRLAYSVDNLGVNQGSIQLIFNNKVNSQGLGSSLIQRKLLSTDKTDKHSLPPASDSTSISEKRSPLVKNPQITSKTELKCPRCSLWNGSSLDEAQGQTRRKRSSTNATQETWQRSPSNNTNVTIAVERGSGKLDTNGRTEAFHFLGHFPFHDLDLNDRLWLEKRRQRGSLSVEGTFLWTAGMLGSIANGAVFITAAVSRYFRKPLHILVSCLALFDLYVTLFYIPTYTYYLVERTRDLDNNKTWQESALSYCNITRGVFVFVASLTVSFQVLITLYLFIMTCSRDLASKIFSTKNTVLYICNACLLNILLLFLPTMFGYPRVDFYPNSHLCSPQTHQKFGGWRLGDFRIIYHSAALVVHILELLFICFFIINIFLAVIRARLVRKKYGRRDRTANMNYSRAIQITIVVFSSFLLLWLPVYIINFADLNHDQAPEALHHLVFDLLLFKSCFNPLLYIYAIKALR